jgi:hypothetical protein
MMDLQIKRDGRGVPLPLPEQPIEDINIEGFYPIIINVAPVSVPMLLGLSDAESPTGSAKQERENGDLSAVLDKSAAFREKLALAN